MTQRLAAIISERARILQAAGIDQAVAEVELVLCYLLKTDRAHLYFDGQTLTNGKVLRQLDEIVARRTTRYPLQYILGEVWFYGRRFSVNPSVMIPTPETELLCEVAVGFVKEKRQTLPAQPRILDLGTGSGVIAVTLACEVKQSVIVAVDVSRAALEVAGKNVADHGVSDRIEFRRSDFFSAIGEDELFHLILSNPPYVSTGEYKNLPLEVLADPKEALLAGDDGLDAIRVLLREAPDYLAKGGRIMFEIGYRQAESITKLTESDDRYRTISIIKDLNDIDRVVILSCDE
ncbi:MAG: peptide chain release factor N(5)-glutamine methyltransferase [Candidatus Zixiibacteriota bacterium]